MSTRLQKLQKIKLPAAPQHPPPPINHLPLTQTIIINNPNININYMNESSRHGPMSSRGLDNWNLNNNLKEFSQTRQLGFFKKKQERGKSSSPYIIHKVRTQDFKSVNKMGVRDVREMREVKEGKGGVREIKGMKETMNQFRKNETIGHIQPATIEHEREREDRNRLERVAPRKDKTIAQKFYQGKKYQREGLRNGNNETLQPSHLANPESLHATKRFRQGRFEAATERMALQPPRHEVWEERQKQGQESDRDSSDSLQSPTKPQLFPKSDREADSSDSTTLKPQKSPAPRLNLELRRRQFNRTIAGIDKLLLSQTQLYFDHLHQDKLPQAEIELCVNSMSYPERVGASKERSCKREADECKEYQFLFEEEERRKRVRTPKRKKMYV